MFPKSIRTILIFLLITAIHAGAYSQSADAVLTDSRTGIKIENGMLIKDIYEEITIYNRKGEKYCNIGIPFSKLCKVSNIEAKITDLQGNIIKKLSKSDIEERSNIPDFSFYEDEKEKRFTLNHSVFPYKICYNYQTRESQFFNIGTWVPVYSYNIPTLKATLQLTVPRNYHVFFKQKNIGSFSSDTTKDQIRYNWSASYTKQITNDLFSPSMLYYLPYLKIVPENFTYEKAGSNATWVNYGDWNYSLIDGQNVLPDNTVYEIKKIVSSASSKKDAIKTLYHKLQDETRYINISIKTGGMKPYPASYVDANKYGDCKALTNYMKSILDAAGIYSIYTLVIAGEDETDLDLDFPSQQFNHAILCVPLEKDTIWLDNTSNLAFGYLGVFTQNKNVLLVKKSESELKRTPSLTQNEVECTKEITVKTGLTEQSTIQARNRYRGKSYETLFQIATESPKSIKNGLVNGYFIPNEYELNSFQIIKPDRDSTYIDLEYTAITKSIFKKFGNDIVMQPIPMSIPDFETPEVRTLPVKIVYPIVKTEKFIYETGKLKAENLPEKNNVSSRYGSYHVSYQLENNQLIIKKNFVLYPGFYNLKEYLGFFDFIKSINHLENTKITLHY